MSAPRTPSVCGRVRFGASLLAVLFALSACEPEAPRGNPHYVLGQAWKAEGVWHYPVQSLDLNETGLAETYGPDHPELTTDGEWFDPALLTAAHQTLQLPAVARVTNLETGLQTLVRINDRGPSNPGRIMAVTPRVAILLGFSTSGIARVRLEVLQAESRAAAEAIQGGNAIKLDVATAPRARVQQESLAPPPGAHGSAIGVAAASDTPPAGSDADPAVVAPSVLRLPETLARIVPAPGVLWIRLGSFSRAEFARMQVARLQGLGADIEKVRNGRTVDYRVTLGPYNRVADADAALSRVIAAGITDGRIVIE